MRYKFPKITNIDPVLEAIRGRDEFVVGEKDGFTVIDYQVSMTDTFPCPHADATTEKERFDYMVRRECRGIKFYPNGHIAARPYHKFFNLGEKEETQPNKINFGPSNSYVETFWILDKLDGSMIHPLLLDDQVVFCTRMGPTDVAQMAQKFTEAHKWYLDFSYDMMKSGLTPLFEWCSRKNRIVIDYPDDQLVLTGVRHTNSGEYLTLDQLYATTKPYDIPIVGQRPGTFTTLSEFVKEAENEVGNEGYVFRFRNGHMLKVKNLWYVQIHKAKDAIIFEKNVIAMLIEDNVDDVMPHLMVDDRQRLDVFRAHFWNGVEQTAKSIETVVDVSRHFTDGMHMSDREAKKLFATQTVAKYTGELAVYKPLLFKLWDGRGTPLEIVIEAIRDNLSSQTKVDQIRRLFGGIRWEDY